MARSGADASCCTQKEQCGKETPQHAARLHTESRHFPPLHDLAFCSQGHELAVRSEPHVMKTFRSVVEGQTQTVADAHDRQVERKMPPPDRGCVLATCDIPESERLVMPESQGLAIRTEGDVLD